LTLRISPAGRGPLRGEVRSASFIEYDAAGRMLREIPLGGLPATLPEPGGIWSAPSGR
jgi:hypothetical protein